MIFRKSKIFIYFYLTSEYTCTMNIVSPKTIEEIIIIALANKSRSGQVLLQEVQKTKSTFTKQALYVTLRALLKEEVIIKHSMKFSLSKVWLSRMREFFENAEARYGTRREGVDFLALEDGDKITYSFKNPEEGDHFLAHVFAVLTEIMPQNEPVYLYNPHEWFLLARAESEIELFHDMRDRKRNLWMLVGNNDPLDLWVKQYFDGTYLQYYIPEKPLFEKNTYYLNIYGTHIMEAHLDQTTADEMDVFYRTTAVWNDDAKKKLGAIVSKGKTKITISKNERKAKKLKRLMGQYFYIHEKEKGSID